ncbi:hypothetical protein ACQEVF_13620 [Nonomuraea polychroma]|uniref:hypothetical protein n=1 Tax=Nonomuraea polychroma TaxID=46176 RepID=UPI003D8B90C9
MKRIGLGIAALAADGPTVSASAVPASAAGAPDTCISGFVWREARPSDHVCVTPAVRRQTLADNAAAASRRASSSAIRSPITINRDVRFGGGIPVGGWTSLTLNRDGTYKWSGHVRDSGAPSYTHSSVCIVRFSSGTAFVFKSSGRLHGTFESGSRNHDWNKQGHSQALAQTWRTSTGHRWNCQNSVTLSVAGLVDSVLKAVGTATKVISIVA